MDNGGSFKDDQDKHKSISGYIEDDSADITRSPIYMDKRSSLGIQGDTQNIVTDHSGNPQEEP